MTKISKKVFQEVYPFTTENISEYFQRLPIKKNKVFTVGSSLDQAFNCLLLGARQITVYDMNANTEEFYNLKKELIMSTSREELYDKILLQKQIPMTPDILPKEEVIRINPYLQSDYNYQELRKRLKENKINFICGDIFNTKQSLQDEKFDLMIFSNILQYLSFFAKEEKYNFLRENFHKWTKHLNDEGVLQLFYLYSYSISELKKGVSASPGLELKKIHEALKGSELIFEWFEGYLPNTQDSILTYTKKR